MTPPDLLEIVAEGRKAMAAPMLERVHACLTVMPLLVEALDYVAIRQVQLQQIQVELTKAVRHLRETVWEAQRSHPDITYKAAKVQKALREVNEVIDRLELMLQDAHGPADQG